MDEKNHNIILEGRKKLSLTACSEVVSFNESEVVLVTDEESVVISGEGLRVEEVSKMSGEIVIRGERIDSIIYRKGRGKSKESVIGRIFK
ncbi:MAG: YabP/YqfC family sporulation protein [Clostridia bacterium]|nr:YabP/YqfC family sporulation protein [Clostridia bacterium]